MKICFVSFEYPPLMIGGAGVYAKYLTKELARLNHQVHVISPGSGQDVGDFIENGVFVHRIRFLNQPFLRAPSYWFSLRKYYKTLDRAVGGFDVLHANVVSDFSLTKSSVTIPRIVTVHHLARNTLKVVNASVLRRLQDLRGELGLTPFIEKRVIKRACKIIAVSNFTKQCLTSAYGIPNFKVDVIYHGVIPQEYECCKEHVQKVKEDLGIKDEFTFLFVGRLEARKGLQVLIKAFKNVFNKYKKVKLVIVGSGNQASFQKLANSLNISNGITFMGRVDDLSLKKLYNLCDVFVSPSLLEGFGLTLLEAMATGKPVIATRVGGFLEIVKDGENGVLVHPNNINELASALTFFMENPDLAKRIGKFNKKYVSMNFNWEKSAKLTVDVYENCLQF